MPNYYFFNCIVNCKVHIPMKNMFLYVNKMTNDNTYLLQFFDDFPYMLHCNLICKEFYAFMIEMCNAINVLSFY